MEDGEREQRLARLPSARSLRPHNAHRTAHEKAACANGSAWYAEAASEREGAGHLFECCHGHKNLRQHTHPWLRTAHLEGEAEAGASAHRLRCYCLERCHHPVQRCNLLTADKPALSAVILRVPRDRKGGAGLWEERGDEGEDRRRKPCRLEGRREAEDLLPARVPDSVARHTQPVEPPQLLLCRSVAHVSHKKQKVQSGHVCEGSDTGTRIGMDDHLRFVKEHPLLTLSVHLRNLDLRISEL